MVTGDSQEKVMIFRYKQTNRQTLHHNIYIVATLIFIILIHHRHPVTIILVTIILVTITLIINFA